MARVARVARAAAAVVTAAGAVTVGAAACRRPEPPLVLSGVWGDPATRGARLFYRFAPDGYTVVTPDLGLVEEFRTTALPADSGVVLVQRRLRAASSDADPDSVRVVRVDSSTLRVYAGRGFGPAYPVRGQRPDGGTLVVRLSGAEAVAADQRAREGILLKARIFGRLEGPAAR